MIMAEIKQENERNAAAPAMASILVPKVYYSPYQPPEAGVPDMNFSLRHVLNLRAEGRDYKSVREDWENFGGQNPKDYYDTPERSAILQQHASAESRMLYPIIDDLKPVLMKWLLDGAVSGWRHSDNGERAYRGWHDHAEECAKDGRHIPTFPHYCATLPGANPGPTDKIWWCWKSDDPAERELIDSEQLADRLAGQNARQIAWSEGGYQYGFEYDRDWHNRKLRNPRKIAP
jgi:hypothetical protein